MFSLFTPVVVLIVSVCLLDVADSFSTLVRSERDVQDERMEAGLSEMAKGQFHHGSAIAPLALSFGGGHHPEGGVAALASGKTFVNMDGHATGEHRLSRHGQYTNDEQPPGGHHLNGNGHLTGEHNLSGHSGVGHHGGGTDGIHDNAQGPKGDPSSDGQNGHSTSSAHASAIGDNADGMGRQSGRPVHHTSTASGDHEDKPASVATGGSDATSGGKVGEFLEMLTKLRGPEMLGKTAAISGNTYGAGAPSPPPPRAVSVGGTGSKGGSTQSFTTFGVSRGGAGHIRTRGTGPGNNASQPTEEVYVMVVPAYGEMSKGRGGYTVYNNARTYKVTQGTTKPGAITYTVGYSLQGRPMFYGGTGGRGGSTYTVWPVTYGAGAPRSSYPVVAYTAFPSGHVVTTRAQQDSVRPAATAQAAYYMVKSGRPVATTQQRLAPGMTYAAVPAVVVPAQA